MTAKADDFRRIDFGYAEAKFELEKSPRLLRQGYLDLGGAEMKVLDSHEFLVLGYKGSGKSAIGARLRLLSQDSPGLYATEGPISVAELPLDGFKGIAPEGIDALQRYQYGWQLLLLSGLVLRIADDGAADKDSLEAAREARAQLLASGVQLSSPRSLKRLSTTKVDSKVSLPRFYERTESLQPTSHENAVLIWIAYLEAVCESFRSTKKHYYFFDGLDDMRLIGEGKSLLLAGLLQAADHVNEVVRVGGAPLKVVLACRTDVYGRIDSPRAGKIRRDFAVEMDWYQNPREVSRSHLVAMTNKRARLVDPSLDDLFKTFFPARLLGRSAQEAVIEQTRHTPRDLLQLLKIVQKQVADVGPLSRENILGGFADYSETYFMDEAHDAMRFYFDEPVRAQAMDLLGTLRHRTFTLDEMTEAAKSPRFKRLDLAEMLKVLFDNGFVGNKTAGGPTKYSEDYYRFQYKSTRATLRWDEEFALHFGLWKALNVA